MNLNRLIFRISCITTPCIFLIGCNPNSEIDYPIQYEGDKLILYSHLQQDHEIEVQVLKTSHPLSIFYLDSFYISDAQVTLYANDSVYVLQYTGSGYYETEGHLEAKSGNSYKVEAKAPGFPDAYSDWEKVPEPGIISNLEWAEIDTFIRSEGYLKFTILVPEDKPFQLFVLGLADNEIYDAYSTIIGGIGPHCEFTVLVPECLTLNGDIKMEVEKKYYNGNERFNFTHLIPTLSIISVSLKNYEESISLQSDAFSFPFIPNSSPFTNIHNGYGLVSSSTEVSMTIQIK